MPGARHPLERAWLAGLGLACLCLARCGGDEFAAGGTSGSAGTGGGSGGSDGGGMANDAGGSDVRPESGSVGYLPDGGSPDGGGGQGPTGDGGDGGAISSGCNCPPGNYCKDASTDCLACSALNRLRFSPPERLSSVSAGAQGSRFPRVGKTSTDLFYRLEGEGLRYTTDWSTSAGSTLALNQAQDRAPLLLSGNVTSLPIVTEPFNFAFDRLVEMTKRKLHFGQWQNTLQGSALAPAPFNGSGSSDFSPAIALHPTGSTIPRLFWMTDRDPGQPLVLATAELALDAVGANVLLSVGQAGCLPMQEDLTPWVSEDGKTLLFSTQRKEAGCVAGTAQRDIYTTALQAATGQPPVGSAAIPLMDVNGPGNDVDPSFSADLCELYFASDRDNATGRYSLYRARRR